MVLASYEMRCSKVFFIISYPPVLSLNLYHPGSPSTLGSIDDPVALISSPVKSADVIKSFGSIAAVQNGGSDAAKSAVISRPPLVSATPTSSSHDAVVSPPSTQSPVPKFDEKSLAKLFQVPPQSASTPSPEGVSDINGEACNEEEYEGRRKKEEKRDREEQEKPTVPPVRLLRVCCPVHCASVFIMI